jgi:hypothetical protein
MVARVGVIGWASSWDCMSGVGEGEENRAHIKVVTDPEALQSATSMMWWALLGAPPTSSMSPCQGGSFQLPTRCEPGYSAPRTPL